MKNYILFLLCSFAFAGICQKPEKIYGNARQQKPLSYYKEQAGAWKKEVDKNPKDATAWYNYYYASRNIMFNDTTSIRSAKEKNATVEKIVEDMGKQIPESYEYNLCRWQISGFNPAALPYLKKAAQLGEGRSEHLDFMINQGELDRNLADRDLYSVKKFEAGQFSTGIIYYNYNVLMGLEKNAILITSGDNDTYPIWYLQAQGIRKDVTVLNMSFLLGLDDYRDKQFAELGIGKWQKTAAADGKATEADHERFRKGIIRHIAANKKNHPVYLGLTSCDQRYTAGIEQNLYLTGLAYLYSNEPVDNMALLKNNFEHQYAFDYMDKPFYREISPDMVKLINSNYIVPLLRLYDHYNLSGETARKDWARAKLLLISRETENEAEVLKHIAQG